MDCDPLILSEDMSVRDALDRLLERDLSGAPVLNHMRDLVGYFSIQDAIVNLYSADFQPSNHQKIQQLMRKDVKTVSPRDDVFSLAENMSEERKRLENDSAATDCYPYERLRRVPADHPLSYPVMDGRVLIGTVSSLDVMRALFPLYLDEPACI
ncbi:CBS domain-containing protein [Pseudovibrio flavus]|uniref:CBS domain-containing protein n=1 Tax=Pseudovibrio flavus TaxID=2529854 RepID=UPI00211CDE0A|nr:CBS domain-containing protein [Pseudovibrio flavus]